MPAMIYHFISFDHNRVPPLPNRIFSNVNIALDLPEESSYKLDDFFIPTR